MSYRHWAEVSGQARDRAPVFVIVSVEDLNEGGYFLTAFDSKGGEVASIWHGGLQAARQWAESEYGDGVSENGMRSLTRWRIL